MPRPSSFLYGCIGFAALTFVGAAVLQTPSLQTSLETHTPDAMHREMETALAQAHQIYGETSGTVGPTLQSLSHATDIFVSSNATSARLQFEGMTNNVSIPLSRRSSAVSIRLASNR